ncbi:MAG: biopolymer transporter ExbD [Pseudomonadota bacterium]
MIDDDRILPLINVVFLLLIFFMVVGRLSASDPFEINPPESISQGAPATDDFLIAIGTEGALALNNELMEEDELIARIVAANPAQLRMKTDNNVEANRVIALMERLRASGISSVRLMTVPRHLDHL